jgi:hypothetical protein
MHVDTVSTCLQHAVHRQHKGVLGHEGGASAASGSDFAAAAGDGNSNQLCWC